MSDVTHLLEAVCQGNPRAGALQEAAEVLGLSTDAAYDLSVHARAWLYREMARARY
jgi:hypothetical protein